MLNALAFHDEETHTINSYPHNAAFSDKLWDLYYRLFLCTNQIPFRPFHSLAFLNTLSPLIKQPKLITARARPCPRSNYRTYDPSGHGVRLIANIKAILCIYQFLPHVPSHKARPRSRGLM